MANDSVTYRYQFGVALDEAGFNLISAGLYTTRPELFSYSTDIVVKPGDSGPPQSPAHILTVYAVADKPFSINLYPVDGLPSLPQDSLLMQGDVSFSLTDSLLGTITRIGITFQATASITLSNAVATMGVIDFKLTDIRGEDPGRPGSLAVAPVVGGGGITIDDDSALGRTFKAIVNYLSELYLRIALEKAVVQFPIPPLDQLAGFGTLGPLPIDGIFIRNKALYVDVGEDLSSPVAFPGPSTRAIDLRVGVSTSGLTKILGAFLPAPVPLELGNSGTTLHLTSNLVIPEVDFRLIPGASAIPVAIHLSGPMNLHVQIPIPVFGGTFSFDVPIPIDPLTQYAGQVVAGLQIDDPSLVPGAIVSIRLTPDVNFFDAWFALIVTDYRDYLANAFRNAANNAANQLIGQSFCSVPIIGWIVCGVIDVTAQVIGFLVGAVLDFFVSNFLTAIVNTIGRVVLAFFKTPNFTAIRLQQATVQKLLGVTIKDGQIEIVDNGRDADLQVDLWFQSQGLPVPPEPQPVRLLPPPQPEPVPRYPGATILPEYDAHAFEPLLVLPVPTWTDAQRQQFLITIESPHGNSTASGQISFEHTAQRWRLRHTLTDATGVKLTEAWADYDDRTFYPIHSDYAAYGTSVTVREMVDFSISQGQIVASLGLDGQSSSQRSIPVMTGISSDFDEFWVYRLAHAGLSTTLSGKFGRAGIVSPTSAINWVREIPVAISVIEGTLDWAPSGKPLSSTPVWVVSANDELRTTVAHIAKDGIGLLKMQITAAEGTSIAIRQ